MCIRDRAGGARAAVRPRHAQRCHVRLRRRQMPCDHRAVAPHELDEARSGRGKLDLSGHPPRPSHYGVPGADGPPRVPGAVASWEVAQALERKGARLDGGAHAARAGPQAVLRSPLEIGLQGEAGALREDPVRRRVGLCGA
eukprot:1072714-Pyramimonas_sp.AAC.1